MPRVSVKWAKHLQSEDEKEKFLQAIYSSRVALDRLNEILDELVIEAEAKQTNFDVPNWPYLQASLIGEIKALKKLKNIITIN